MGLQITGADVLSTINGILYSFPISEISFIGKTLRVLVDQSENNIGVGRTEYDSPEIDNIVNIEGQVEKGEFVNIQIESANEYELIGKPLV